MVACALLRGLFEAIVPVNSPATVVAQALCEGWCVAVAVTHFSAAVRVEIRGQMWSAYGGDGLFALFAPALPAAVLKLLIAVE